VFALEKKLPSEDQPKYRIIDPVHLGRVNRADIRASGENCPDRRVFSVNIKNRLVKSWTFKMVPFD